MQFVSLFNLLVASAVVAVQAFTFLLLACLFLSHKFEWSRKAVRVAKKYTLYVALFIAASGAVLTLVYYYLVGYIPCDLAWYQHVCLYPLVVLLSLHIFYREPLSMRFALALGLAGLALSCLQVFVEYGLVGTQFIGGAISCSTIDVMEFGYISIPVMATSGFLALAVLLYISPKRK